MLKNLTYNDPTVKRAIDKSVGKAFTFFQGLKMGGTGSQKFIIETASEEIMTLLEKDNATNYSNIELRPKGIIIGFKSHQKTYGLILPFQEMMVRNANDYLTIESSDFFIKMKTLNSSPVDPKFLKRISNS